MANIAFPRFALVAQPRSGTHFFRSLLNQNEKIFCYGEVLFPWRHFWGFFNWLRIRQIEEPHLVYPHRWREVLNPYLNELYNFSKDEFGKSHVGFDFKIPQLLTFQDSCEVLRQFGFAIIHLRRINTAAAVISLQRANVTQDKLGAVHGAKHEVPTIDVSTFLLKEQIFEYQTGDAYIKNKLSVGGYVEIFYEDLLSEQGIKYTEAVLGGLFRLTINLSRPSRFEKQSPSDIFDGLNCDDEARDIINRYNTMAAEREAKRPSK